MKDSVSPSDQTLALAAASQASEAVAELLRFVREGEGREDPFEQDCVALLADGLRMTLEIEGADLAGDETGQLYGALVQFLGGLG